MLVVGVSGLVVFYMSVMAIGIWAGSKRDADRVSGADLQGALLAGRALPFPVGVISLLATCMGAEALLGGIPEAVYARGVLWCHIPIGYCLSFLIGGLGFSTTMRNAAHETLVDPIQERYGPRVGALIATPAVLCDIFRSAAVLTLLGSAMWLVLDMSWTLSVVATAVFAAIYTLLGGLFSVAYTDVAQVAFVTLGLVLAAPFASSNPSASSTIDEIDWLGSLNATSAPYSPWQWVDTLLLLALGGIPSQSYFQRILATRDANAARLLSLTASGCCLVLAVPSMAIGVIAKRTEWHSLEGFPENVTEVEEARNVLPLVVRFMTPEWVSFIGLGAVSAAVMSSVDSSYLSASSLICKNLYRVILRPKAPDYEVLWALRFGVVSAAAVSAILALSTPKIICLALFCADLVYIIIFPQLLLCLYWRRGANSYGAIFSFLVGAMLRFLAGDPGLGVPALLHYPLFEAETGRQGAPHRTIAMMAALVAHLVASLATRTLLHPKGGKLGSKYDFLGCFADDGHGKAPPTAGGQGEGILVEGRKARLPTPPLGGPPASAEDAIPMVRVRVRFSDDPDKDLEECE